MLAGLNLQPGAWDATEGDLDDVLLSDITMHNVSTPFHFSLKPGNTAGTIIANRIAATGVYRAASSVESWGEAPFTNVTFRDVSIDFKGGGRPEDARARVEAPGVDARNLPAWAFYARNVKNLSFENVRLTWEKDDLRPALILEGVEKLRLDGFKFRRAEGAADPLVLAGVAAVELRDVDIRHVEARCAELKLSASDPSGRFLAGKPYSATAVVESQGQEGLGKVELQVAGQKAARWVWLGQSGKKEVIFNGLTAPAAGTHEVRAGECGQSVVVEP